MQFKDFDVKNPQTSLDHFDNEPFRTRISIPGLTEDHLEAAGVLGKKDGVLVRFNKDNKLYTSREGLLLNVEKVPAEKRNLADLEASLYVITPADVEVIADTKENLDATVKTILAIDMTKPAKNA